MKRTLTAAATLLASSAGAVGFAGTATAADSPDFPDSLPVDNNIAQTAFHAAGTMHSATHAVGDVLPLGQQPAGRSGGSAGGHQVGAVIGQPSPVGDAVEGVQHGAGQLLDHAKPVGAPLDQSGGRSESPHLSLPSGNQSAVPGKTAGLLGGPVGQVLEHSPLGG